MCKHLYERVAAAIGVSVTTLSRIKKVKGREYQKVERLVKQQTKTKVMLQTHNRLT